MLKVIGLHGQPGSVYPPVEKPQSSGTEHVRLQLLFLQDVTISVPGMILIQESASPDAVSVSQKNPKFPGLTRGDY